MENKAKLESVCSHDGDIIAKVTMNNGDVFKCKRIYKHTIKNYIPFMKAIYNKNFNFVVEDAEQKVADMLANGLLNENMQITPLGRKWMHKY